MRQKLVQDGADELNYEIRGIVKKAEILEKLGQTIYWENIGDPIQKRNIFPEWMKEIVSRLLKDNSTYGYCHSKGLPKTREYLAQETNARGGVQISAEDITFFNGLGDAIAKVYQFIVPTSRIMGPSPAYSTHSSAEAAHANHEPLTYRLDPDHSWYPDMDDLYYKVKYNPNVVGILIINPDNPTGMVYPPEILREIVQIAREMDLFIISDEIYNEIYYHTERPLSLAEVIGEVPGIAMKGISKELPWPGARCGWVEYYNRHRDPQFQKLCETLDNAKMIEVCSTKLPQLALPLIKQDPRYRAYREEENQKIGRRSEIIREILGDLEDIRFNVTYGAFYNTIIFKKGTLRPGQFMQIDSPEIAQHVQGWTAPEQLALDQRFVYYLLAAKGVCVVPISSFCSELQGFRVTLLEENESILRETFQRIREGIQEYLSSA